LWNSPGEVASTFNRFTNLDKVDNAIGILASDLRIKKAAKEKEQSTSAELEKRIKGFSYLEQLEDLVIAEEDIEKEVQKADTALALLLKLSDELTRSGTKIGAIAKCLSVDKVVVKKAQKLLLKAQTIDGEISSREKELERLSDCHERYRATLVRIGEIRSSRPLWDKELEFQKVLADIETEMGLKNTVIVNLTHGRNDLVAITEKMKKCSSSITIFKAELAKAKEELKEVDVCPICTSKLTAVTKKAMLENLK